MLFPVVLSTIIRSPLQFVLWPSLLCPVILPTLSCVLAPLHRLLFPLPSSHRTLPSGRHHRSMRSVAGTPWTLPLPATLSPPFPSLPLSPIAPLAIHQTPPPRPALRLSTTGYHRPCPTSSPPRRRRRTSPAAAVREL